MAAGSGFSSRQKLTLLATSVGLFMIYLDATIVNVALPDIQRDFDAGEQGLQWVVAAYSLTMGMFIMSAATLSDQKGRRKAFIGGMVLFAVASALCGAAPSLGVLNVGRGLQGVGAATVNVASLALVSAAFPDPKAKAKAIGLWTGIASVGLAIGPTLGGVLTETHRLAQHLLRQRHHGRDRRGARAGVRRGVARSDAAQPRPARPAVVHRRHRHRSRTR